MSIFNHEPKNRTLDWGDPRLEILEGLGGRPTIVGDWNRTQDNLVRTVLGLEPLPLDVSAAETEYRPDNSVGFITKAIRSARTKLL